MGKKIQQILRIIVSVSLIAYLLSLMDLQDLGTRLVSVYVPWLIPALGMLLCQTALSSLKWKIILAADGIDSPFNYLFRTYLIGNFISLFLPSSIGGDVYRVYSVGRNHGHWGKTVTSVFFDRLTGLFALISISLLAYLALPDSRYEVWLGFAYVGLILSFLLATSAGFANWVERIPWSGARKIVATPLRSLRVYRSSPATFFSALLIAFVFQFTVVVVNKIYCAALGIEIPFALLLVIVPLVYLTDAIPISINGIGVRDTAFVFFFTLLGYQKEEGLALAITVLLMRYAFGLIGGCFFLFDSLKRPQSPPAPDPGDPRK